MTERLPPQPNEWIDRSKPLKFKFEGREYTGFAGDTISSALAANGVRLLGRSFKYHRPRGIYSLANHDVNVLVEDGKRTNLRGDVTPVWEGADLRAVNTQGGVAGDRLGIIDWFSKMLPVGFYYKAFNSRRLFPFYERRMRNIAGLGAVSPKWGRENFPAVYDFCDVLVVGAGPAGLTAALAAGQQGLKVVVADEQPRAGGSLNYQWGDQSAAVKLRAALDVGNVPNIDLRCSTVAVGNYADNWVALIDDVRLTKMRARALIIATGAMEQPAVFANNDLPGVMLATAAQRLVHQYSVRPFQRGVVFIANDFGRMAVFDLVRAGVKIGAVVDLDHGGPGDFSPELKELGIQYHENHAVTLALPSSGKRGIRGVVATPLDSTGRPKDSGGFEIPCDGLAMSVGYAPADGLFYQGGGRMAWSQEINQFIPKSAPPGLFSAGRINGIYGCEEESADGTRAGLAAAAFVGDKPNQIASDPQRRKFLSSHPYPIFPHPTTKCFVDFDEDVHYKDFVNAAQEGFDQVELMKRYSTFGMGTTQGKIANINAIRILAHVKGQTVGQTGVTTARPFIHPVPLGHLAGRGFHPHRRTPIEGRHEALGAVFMNAGDWKRPAYYSRPSTAAAQAIAEEVTAVRNAAGMIDVGTLGKIEINGLDAGEFIERIYTGRFAKMKPGTARYGLMCDESGVIIDDGLVARLAEERFYVTTTTSAAGAVHREMQRWAQIWGLQVVLASATGSRGGINLAGPKAREILKELCDFDLSSTAFPYMAVREGTIADAPARFLRVGFVGEWGCEIHVPAYSALHVWSAIEEAGKKHGIRPFGVEAQRVLRLEKAHIIVSQDTDGLTNPYEANMAWAVKDDKPFFIGQRSLRIIHPRPLKRILAGFTLPGETPATKVPKECHLIIENKEIVGRITSVTRSPTLNQVIGLAFVSPDRSQPGTQFQIRLDDGSLVTATVVQTPFYDPKAERQM
ncbi:MAG: 2Fe-2S iron-sulfur cluster-binding protein [Pirellulaceae bacterium]